MTEGNAGGGEAAHGRWAGDGQAKLEAVLASMTDAVFISDTEGRFIDFNEAFATFHKFKDKAACAKTLREYPDFLEVYLPSGELAPLEQWAVPRALRGETCANAEYGLKRTDTGETWVGSYSFAPIRDAGGAIVGSVVAGRDVTREKKAQEALARALERLDLATSAAGIGIWDWDIPVDRLVWDDQMHRLYGVRRGDFASAYEAWLARVHPEDRDAANAASARAVAGIQDYSTEFRVVLPGGEIRHLEARATVIRDAQGLAARMVGVNYDVTGQRRQEAERLRLEAQLAQAQRMESIGRLAGGVAHDFNNMLGVIMAHAGMAMEGLDPSSPLYESMAEIGLTAERSAALTRQLLAFARRQTIDPKVLDLNEAVQGVLKMLQRLIDESVDLEWRPGEGTWPVRMDPGQVDQILANLCVNARDSIATAGRVRISTGNATLGPLDCEGFPDRGPGDFAWLAVSDNGSGMGPDTLAHLFEPFFTTKAPGKGTGLGLATVYGIVRQNHGFIQVDSRLGQGSTFKVYLPRHAAAGAAAPAAAPDGQPRSGGETVLLVEDEAGVLRITTAMLRSLGYVVLPAATPSQALELARRHGGAVDLLLTDVVMPGMNGRELVEAVRALHPGLKRLYMSGYTSDIIAPQGVLDEGVDFLQKPFAKNALAEKVRQALER